jgi:hypothetical protein
LIERVTALILEKEIDDDKLICYGGAITSKVSLLGWT